MDILPRYWIGHTWNLHKKYIYSVHFNRGTNILALHHELQWPWHVTRWPAHGSAPWPLPSSIHLGHWWSKFLPNNWSKTVVHGPDPSKDTLKRLITTLPPSITTTHHDGGLPSPLSCTLVDEDPSLPYTPTQRPRQNLRERHQFQNDGWTKWEALKAPISKWWVDKMGGHEAHRQIGSKTSNGESWLGVLEEIRGRRWTNSRTF